ncbi:hypothetical protein [Nostoc sp.]
MTVCLVNGRRQIIRWCGNDTLYGGAGNDSYYFPS